MAFKLSDVKEPRFEVEFLDGHVESYDPWEVAMRVSSIDLSKDVINGEETFDLIRAAFRTPTSAERQKLLDADPAAKVTFLSMHQCMELQTAVVQFIEGLDVVKKAVGLSQK